MFGFGLMTWLKVGVVVALVAAAGFFWLHIEGLKSDLIAAEVRVSQLETITEQYVTALDDLKSNLQQEKILLGELAQTIQDARVQAEAETRVFDEHDFKKLLAAKPGLVGPRMQRATRKLFDNIETATAAP